MGGTVTELRRRLADAESELHRLRARVLEAEEGAALARKSAMDAWAFARVMFPARPKGGMRNEPT